MSRQSVFHPRSSWIILTSVVSSLTLASSGYRAVQASEHGEAKPVEAKHDEIETKHAETETKHGEIESKHAETETKHVDTFVGRTLSRYKTIFSDIQSKVDELKRADEENGGLRQENANLRLQLESREFECHSKVAAQRTHEYGTKLEGETGLAIGRTLASIQYEIPTQIQPVLLHTLAVTYFKAGEDEKAAKILHFLLGLEGGEFRTSKNILMAGILWYRLDNVQIADALFTELLAHKGAEQPASAILSQARLWRALASRKKGDRPQSQELLRELLNHHPHSAEAAWINQTKEAGRVPSSQH